jgi:uncharacterized protein YbjT (DUF2867 family)
MNNTTSKTALLAGATGLIGNEVLQLLMNDDTYTSVVLVTRKPLSISHPKAKNIVIDFDKLHELSLHVQHVDDVFCCLGTTMATAGSKEAFYKVDFTYCYELAKVSLLMNAKQFLIVSAMGANLKSSIYYNRVKGEIENKLKELSFESLKILQPSMLLGNRKERRPGELGAKRLFKALAFIFVGSLKKYKAIEASDVAKAMLSIAKMNVKGIESFQSDRLKAIADTVEESII